MENCPYCNAEIEINHDDGYGYTEDETFEQECGKCGYTFTFTTCIMFSYDLKKAPCKNDGEHKFKPVIGAPKAYYVGKERCIYCDEIFITDKEAHDKAMDEYRKELILNENLF